MYPLLRSRLALVAALRLALLVQSALSVLPALALLPERYLELVEPLEQVPAVLVVLVAEPLAEPVVLVLAELVLLERLPQALLERQVLPQVAREPIQLGTFALSSHVLFALALVGVGHNHARFAERLPMPGVVAIGHVQTLALVQERLVQVPVLVVPRVVPLV